MAISTPLLALLAGGAQGYGDVVQRRQAAQQDQQAETARQLLAAAITRGQQAQQNSFDLQRLDVENGYDNARQGKQLTYDTQVRNDDKAIQGNQAEDTFWQDLQDKNPGMPADYYQRIASSWINPVTGQGIPQERINAKLFGPSGQAPTKPGPMTTQLTPAGATLFQSPQMNSGPGLSMGGLASILSRGKSPLPSNQSSPLLGTGGPLMPSRAPATQQVQGAPVPDKDYQPFPLSPIEKAQVDYETGKTNGLADRVKQDYLKQIKNTPPEQQAQITEQYRSMGLPDLPMPGVDVPYYKPDVLTQARVNELDSIQDYRKLSREDKLAYQKWHEAHGDQYQSDVESFHAWEESGGSKGNGIYGFGPQYDKIVARRAAIKSRLSGISSSLSAALGQGLTSAQQNEITALQNEDKQLNQRQYLIQRQGPPQAGAAANAGGTARQNPGDPITIKGVTKTRAQWEAQLNQMQGGAQ